MKLITALGLAALLLTSHNANAKVKGSYQSCSGILTMEGEEYLLERDVNSNIVSWCDAYISEKFIGGENLVRKVLKVCTVGSRCRIKGTFVGHGEFYWNKIFEVSK